MTALILKSSVKYRNNVVIVYIENEEVRLARLYYLETKDAAGALAKMPNGVR